MHPVVQVKLLKIAGFDQFFEGIKTWLRSPSQGLERRVREVEIPIRVAAEIGDLAPNDAEDCLAGYIAFFWHGLGVIQLEVVEIATSSASVNA